MVRILTVFGVVAIVACIIACGGGGSTSRPEPATAKARAGLPPGTKPGVPQLDDPDMPNHDPEDLDADPDGVHLQVNPFGSGEVVALSAQRYDPFIVLARNNDRHLREWEAPRNQANPGRTLAEFERRVGIIRLAPGTKVTVNNSTALFANVSVAAGEPDHGRVGYVLPGTVGRATKLLEWRRVNGK